MDILAVNQTDSFPSCRIKVSAHGIEWFLYNKTAAYDHILSQMQAKEPPVARGSEPRRYFTRTSGLEGKSSTLLAVIYPKSPIRPLSSVWVS